MGILRWGNSAEGWATPPHASEFRNRQGSILERLRAERGWDLKAPTQTPSFWVPEQRQQLERPGPQEQEILWPILKRVPGRARPPENSLRMEALHGPFFFLTLLPPADPSPVGPISVTLRHTSSPYVPCWLFSDELPCPTHTPQGGPPKRSYRGDQPPPPGCLQQSQQTTAGAHTWGNPGETSSGDEWALHQWIQQDIFHTRPPLQDSDM